jgi:hypothetical protein
MSLAGESPERLPEMNDWPDDLTAYEWVGPTDGELVMADPSILLTAEGWKLMDPEITRHLVISKAFYTALQVEDYNVLGAFVDEADVAVIRERRDRLVEALGDIEHFSYERQDEYPEIDEITAAILAEQDPVAEIIADEWFYLMTRSFVAAAQRFILDKLNEARDRANEARDRAAQYGHKVTLDIKEYGGNLRLELIKEVWPKGVEPPAVTAELIRRVKVKWLVYGFVRGATTAAGAGIGLGIGGLIAGPAAPVGAVVGATIGAVASRPIAPAIRAYDHKGLPLPRPAT